jgi:hypothetical protein
MSNTDQLKQAAVAIFGQMRHRKTTLQSEYDDLQSKLAHKKVELDSQVDILSSAYERMLNFRPLLGGKILCPRCWVVNGKESTVAGAQGHTVRCNVCHQDYSIGHGGAGEDPMQTPIDRGTALRKIGF